MNQFYSNEWTETIQKVVREIESDPKTYIGARYLPDVSIPASRIRVEVIEATGGMTNEHLPGTNPKYIDSFGTRVQEYQPPYYKEAVHYDEQRILYLRELGQQGHNIRGIEQYMEIDIMRLDRRIETRKEKQRWDVIFTGGFTWMGKTLSFGIPAGNRAVPVGAAWSSDGINANASANPVQDLRYWLMGGLAAFRKYNVTKIVMNPNTARWILDNPNTRAYLQSMAANPSFANYDLNATLKFLIPGLPEVEIYNAWWQDQTVNASTGHTTVGDATYFVPNGYIYFETSLPGSDKIGDFVQGAHLGTGTVSDPGFGKFLIVEDCTVPGSKGGPSNPYIDIVAGVYGGVKLDRPFDVLTAYVGP